MEDPKIWRAGEDEPEPKEEVDETDNEGNRQDEKPDINLEAEHNKN